MNWVRCAWVCPFPLTDCARIDIDGCLRPGSCINYRWNRLILRICKAPSLRRRPLPNHGMQHSSACLSVIRRPRCRSIICASASGRLCSGTGKFRQKSRVSGVDEQQVIGQAEVEFVLRRWKGMQRTSIFGGVRFQHTDAHVEIYLENDSAALSLPVIQVTRANWLNRNVFS